MTDYPIRLAGHALVSEGIPAWLSEACAEEECGPREPEGADRGSQFAGGHARCSCGVESPHLPSQGKRRSWHRDHKREAAGLTPPTPTHEETP